MKYIELKQKRLVFSGQQAHYFYSTVTLACQSHRASRSSLSDNRSCKLPVRVL